jgi:hypothetical protein
MRDAEPRSPAIDRAAVASKTLYNAAHAIVRHSFLQEGVYRTFAAGLHLLNDHEASCALARKVRTAVLMCDANASTTGALALPIGMPAKRILPRSLDSPVCPSVRLPGDQDTQQGRTLLL